MSPFPNDPYCYPGTDILRNLAEIRDPEDLKIFEATLRAFTSDLAQAAGHRLDWARAALAPDSQQRLYHARDLAVMRGDTSELAQIVASCLSTG